jgi:hypothetical protein
MSSMGSEERRSGDGANGASVRAETSRSWVGIARGAVVTAAVLLVVAAVVTAALPTGAHVVRLYMLQTHAAFHLVVIAWWPLAAAGLLALVAAFAWGAPPSRAWAGRVFAGAAVVIVLGGLYALRVLHHAASALREMNIGGLGQTAIRDWLGQTPAWIAWIGLLVWAGFAVAALLAAAAVLAGRSPGGVAGEDGHDGHDGVDPAARRLALCVSLAVVVAIVVQTMREHVWTTAFVHLAAASGIGGRVWLASAVLVAAQSAWALVALVSAAWSKGRAWYWAVWIWAGACGLLLAAKAVVHAMSLWTDTRFASLLFAGERAPSLLRHIERAREQSVTAVFLALALAAAAGLLIAAGVRQRRAAAGEVSAAGGLFASRRPVWTAAVVMLVALAAPALAAVAVGHDGALLGLAPATTWIQKPEAPAAATAPTPFPATSASPSGAMPVVVGVVPGRDQASGTSGNAGMWSGETVQVNYQPNGAKVVASRCELWIDGRRIAEPARLVYLSAATPTLSWTWAKVFGPGKYTFRVVIVTSTGAGTTWGWTYSTGGA